MALTAGIKKIIEELKNMGVNMERVNPNQIRQAAQVAKTKVSWTNLQDFRRKDEKDAYDLSSVCGGSRSPKKKVAVQTNVDLGALFASTNTETDEEQEEEDLVVVPQTPKRKLKENTVDEAREKEAERKRKEREDKTPMSIIPSTDPKLLDKYDEEVNEEDKRTAVPLSRIKNARVFVVQDLGMDQYVLGVTRSFDVAWDKLRYRQFNDCGECMNKEEALKKINKDGFVALKGLQSRLKVIIKAMELEVE